MHDIDRAYDMGAHKAINFPVMKLLDQIIHSHVFIEEISETGTVEAFIVCSDRAKELGVIEVKMRDYLDIMRGAANDYPAKMYGVRDTITGKVLSWRGSGELPKHVKTLFDAKRLHPTV